MPDYRKMYEILKQETEEAIDSLQNAITVTQDYQLFAVAEEFEHSKHPERKQGNPV